MHSVDVDITDPEAIRKAIALINPAFRLSLSRFPHEPVSRTGLRLNDAPLS